MGGEGGSDDARLTDAAVSVRYFIDEADAGTGPADLLDVGPEPTLSLPLDFGAGNLEFSSGGPGHRALGWATASNGGWAAADVAGSKLDQLVGRTQLTIELVVELTGSNEDCGRLLHLGGWDTQGALGVCATPGNIYLRLNNENLAAADRDIVGQRLVIHGVVDTVADTDDRGRIYIDGQRIQATVTGAEGAALEVFGGERLVIGNRPDGIRSPMGRIHYAAIYSAALDPITVAAHAAALRIGDDGDSVPR
jgi:hypothetical protein